MTRTGRAALTAAILTSALSVADAANQGVTGHPLIDQETNATWAYASSSLLLAATFGLLAAVLAEQADRIDAGSRTVRWLRRLMQGDLAVLALVFAGGLVVDGYPETSLVYRAWGAIAGIAFLMMFLIGTVLGVSLLRRSDRRVAAALMAAPLVLIPITFAVATLAGDWAHPGYAESALYIGLALLGRGAHQRLQAAPRAAAHAR